MLRALNGMLGTQTFSLLSLLFTWWPTKVPLHLNIEMGSYAGQKMKTISAHSHSFSTAGTKQQTQTTCCNLTTVWSKGLFIIHQAQHTHTHTHTHTHSHIHMCKPPTHPFTHTHLCKPPTHPHTYICANHPLTHPHTHAYMHTHTHQPNYRNI